MILDFTEARDDGWQQHQHQLDHMQIILHAECPSCRPTNSVKALKAKSIDGKYNYRFIWQINSMWLLDAFSRRIKALYASQTKALYTVTRDDSQASPWSPAPATSARTLSEISPRGRRRPTQASPCISVQQQPCQMCAQTRSHHVLRSLITQTHNRSTDRNHQQVLLNASHNKCWETVTYTTTVVDLVHNK